MIELSDFLGNILSQISEARKQADEASIRMARQYAEDELLRHLPVPRVRLPNMEITIPVCIKETRKTSVYDPQKGIVRKELVRNVYNTMQKEFVKAYPKRKDLQKGYIHINKQLLTNTDRLKEQLEREREREIDPVVARYISKAVDEFATTRKLSGKNKDVVIATMKGKLSTIVNESIPLTKGRLTAIGITPESNEMKELEVSGQQPMMLKLSVKEEAFELIRKEEEGQRKVEGKEIDNYFLSIE